MKIEEKKKVVDGREGAPGVGELVEMLYAIIRRNQSEKYLRYLLETAQLLEKKTM